MEEIDTRDFVFIPGTKVARLLKEEAKHQKELLVETTFVALVNAIRSPKNFNTRRRQFSTQALVVNELKITPYVGTKSLLMRSTVKSDSGKTYDTILMFTKINFVEDIEDLKDPNKIVEFVASDGNDYAVEKIDLSKTDVKVRCNCLDYRWRFAYYNSKGDTQYGRAPPPYQKKTKLPPVNPNKVQGVCKHVLKSMQSLLESGMFEGISIKL
jgi:hypothetical protein